MRSGSVVLDLSCRDCGSTVTSADRFCPACGTPNVHSKFHPKFGPGVERFEPEIVEDVAAPGVPACPRCHREIELGSELCGACGMDLGPAWERWERWHAVQEWRERNRWTKSEVQPIRGLGVALQVILFLGIAIATVVGTLDTWLLARSTDALLVGPASSTLLRVRDAMELTAAGLVLVGGVVLVAWMRRAYANLPALAVGDLRFAPGWVVWGWLVPGLNLVRPKQLMDDVWRASDPREQPFSGRWRDAAGSTWCQIWWWGLLLGAALGLAGHDLIASNAARSVSDPADLQVGLLVSGLAAFLLAAAAMALLVVVQQIADRQDERAALIASETPDAYQAEIEADRLAATIRGSMAPVFGAPSSSALVHQSDDQGLYGRY